MLERLGDASLYAAQIERLHARARGERDGALLSRMVQDQRRFARILADEVARGRWAPEPAVRRRIAADKPRTVFGLALPDRVVHGVIGELLADAIEPALVDQVHSYRRGRSPAGAVARFADYLRRHRRARPDPRDRGLYLLRADVRDYGDSVPVGPASRLWPMLAGLVGGDPGALALVRAAVMAGLPRERGLPTGSPVATPLGNLYLSPVDRCLAGAGGFYARYGDDLLFAHPEREPFDAARAAAEAELAALGLELNSNKLRLVFFTGCGRSGGRLPGAGAVSYLGCRIGFDGAVGLAGDKLSALRADLARRIARTAAALAGENLESRGRALGAVVAAALDPSAPLAVRQAPALRALVTDRRQLGELDAWLWRALAAALTGERGVRALRAVPPRRLRAWGLPSLVAARNRGRRRP